MAIVWERGSDDPEDSTWTPEGRAVEEGEACFFCMERLTHPFLYWRGWEILRLHEPCAVELAGKLLVDAQAIRDGRTVYNESRAYMRKSSAAGELLESHEAFDLWKAFDDLRSFSVEQVAVWLTYRRQGIVVQIGGREPPWLADGRRLTEGGLRDYWMREADRLLQRLLRTQSVLYSDDEGWTTFGMRPPECRQVGWRKAVPVTASLPEPTALLRLDPQRSFSGLQKKEIYLRSNGHCVGCGAALDSDWHADHIVPHSRGGKTEIINGQALCQPCNQRKHAKILTVEEE